MTKNIIDYKHVKSVSVLILTDKKKELAGKIIANYSDNPSGSVCTAQVFLYPSFKTIKPKIKKYDKSLLVIGGQPYDAPLIGTAGGYGYDKLSSAIANAFERNCTEHPPIKFNGAGIGAVKEWFKNELKLDLVEVL